MTKIFIGYDGYLWGGLRVGRQYEVYHRHDQWLSTTFWGIADVLGVHFDMVEVNWLMIAIEDGPHRCTQSHAKFSFLEVEDIALYTDLQITDDGRAWFEDRV
jgi:hypothetical protein